MTVTIEYMNGELTAYSSKFFRLTKDKYYIDDAEHELTDWIYRILLDGEKVYKFTPFTGYNEWLYQYMVSYWKGNGMDVIHRGRITFPCEYPSPNWTYKGDYNFEVSIDGEDKHWSIPFSDLKAR